MKWIILFGLVALAHADSYSDTTKTASSFCKMNICPKPTISVACGFIKSVAPLCTEVAVSFNKDALIKKHNDYRQKIASGGYFPLYLTASHMAEVKYNDELAQMALYNVKGCAVAQDSCRSTTNFPSAGQNIASAPWVDGMDVDATVASFIDGWFNQYKLGNMVQIKNLVNVATLGFFTQIVQEKVTDVGCSLANISVKGTPTLYLVCNYGYGNLNPIYTPGPAASKCTKTSGSNKALCSVY